MGADFKQGPIARSQQGAMDHLLRLGIDGFGPFQSAEEAARGATANGRSTEQAIKALVRAHVAVAGAQGFVTNVGGLITLPVSMPANIGMGYLIQTHLAASIARVHGHDLDSEEVRTAILLCLLGTAGTEVLKKTGIAVGSKYTMTLIGRIPIAVIRQINKRAGFALVAKYGTKRASITLAKGIPFVGGVIGGGFDATTTRAVGGFADRFFVDRLDVQPAGNQPPEPGQ